MLPPNVSAKNFLYWITLLAELFAAICIVLLLLLVNKGFGGVGWENADKMLNWHAFLMPIGSVFLCGNGIIAYRLLIPKKPGATTFRTFDCIKYVHMFVQASAVIIMSIGLYCAFQSRYIGNRAHLYSLHSWLGMMLAILFLCQFIAGGAVFVCRVVDKRGRENYAAVHAFFGVLTFILSTIVSVIGIDQKIKFSIPDYPALPSEALMVNCFGIFMILFMAHVIYISINPFFEWDPYTSVETQVGAPHGPMQQQPAPQQRQGAQPCQPKGQTTFQRR